ncbi:glycerophosphodiester phosphodiesterase family protein [Tistrella bauzanensis]|uniref:Glycerophosphodiester phosphodiesterase family protein n=1 Tax=Tistrella arctica TaxID=3133430 RepID=A0ABU9YGT5_9PROT
MASPATGPRRKLPVDLPRGRLIAHRGGAAHAPENTLQALAGAAMLGTDWAEIDIRLTACGTPVLMHDADIRATTDAAGRVSALTAAQVAVLDAGAWFGTADALASREPPPTLARALGLAARIGLGIDLDLKLDAHGTTTATATAAARLVGAVAGALAGAGMPQRRIILTSAAPEVLAAAARLLPQVPRGPVLRRPGDIGRAGMAACIADGDVLVLNACRFGPARIRAMRAAAVAATGTAPMILLYGSGSHRRLNRRFTAGADAAIVDAPDRLFGAPLPTPLLPVALRRWRNARRRKGAPSTAAGGGPIPPSPVRVG